VTQILTAIRATTLLHVSDRLLTTIEGVPHDRRSNKTIVVWTADGLCVLGYSGDAFHGRTPMDDWLAGATCSDVSFAWDPAGIPNDLGTLRLDQLFDRMEAWLRWRREATRPAMRRGSSLLIHLAGFRRKGDRIGGHFAGYLGYTPSTSDVQRTVLRELGGIRGRGLALATPMIEEIHELQHEVESASSPSVMGDALIRAMRRAGGRPGVGDDLLCLEANPTVEPCIRLSYSQGAQGRDHALVGGAAVPVSYTPWFVSPWGVIPPMVASTGSMGIMGSPVTIEITDQGDPVVDGNEIRLIAKRQSRRPNAAERPSTLVSTTRRADVHLEAGEHTMEIRYPSPERPPSRPRQ